MLCCLGLVSGFAAGSTLGGLWAFIARAVQVEQYASGLQLHVLRVPS
jgi:ABC-type uncharacterized transport system permease subunit